MIIYFNRHESTHPRMWVASTSSDPKDYCSSVRSLSKNQWNKIKNYLEVLIPGIFEKDIFFENKLSGGTFAIRFNNDEEEMLFIIRSFGGIEI